MEKRRTIIHNNSQRVENILQLVLLRKVLETRFQAQHTVVNNAVMHGNSWLRMSMLSVKILRMEFHDCPDDKFSKLPGYT